MTRELIFETDSVRYEVEDRLAFVTLTRGDRLNALDSRSVDDLAAAWDRLQHSEDRVAVLSGEGKAFCVGADVNDVPSEFPRAVPGMVAPLDKPVIAAIHGYAIGGGYILVQHSDLAIAAEGTRIRYPEAALGFSGGLVAGSAIRVPNKIALELMLVGDWMEADRAAHFGLVNEVVAPEELLERANAWGIRLAGHAPLVVAMMRDAVAQTVPRSPLEVFARARSALGAIEESADKQEGLAAWRESRPPRFQGR